MIIIGELINGTRKVIARVIEEKNEDALQAIARKQAERGAHYIDLNAGRGISLEQEKEDIAWLIKTVQGVTDTPLCIDSSSSEIIQESISMLRGDDILINSTDATDEKLEQLLPLLKQHEGAKIIALPTGDEGIPEDPEKRIELIDKIYQRASQMEIAPERLFFDPLVFPISVNHHHGMATLKTLRLIKERYPAAKTTMGLSNVSFGLPQRFFINTALMTMAVYEGIDSLICDPTDDQLMFHAAASEAMAGRDKQCRRFLRTARRR